MINVELVCGSDDDDDADGDDSDVGDGYWLHARHSACKLIVNRKSAPSNVSIFHFHFTKFVCKQRSLPVAMRSRICADVPESNESRPCEIGSHVSQWLNWLSSVELRVDFRLFFFLFSWWIFETVFTLMLHVRSSRLCDICLACGGTVFKKQKKNLFAARLTLFCSSMRTKRIFSVFKHSEALSCATIWISSHSN